MKLRFATVISRLSDPYLVYGALAATAVIRSLNLVRSEKLFLLFLLLGMIAVPFVTLMFAVSKKLVSNWYITERKQRPLALLILILFTLIDLSVVSQFNDPFITALFKLFLVWVTGFFVITLRFKISGHTSSLTLAALIIAGWYGWPGYLLLMSVPLVAWSRVVRKDHQLTEVIAGIIYSTFIILILSHYLPIF